MRRPPIDPHVAVSFVLALFLTSQAIAKGSEILATQMLEVSGINAIYAQGVVAGYKQSAAGTNRPMTEIGCFTAKVTPQLTLQPLSAGYAAEFTDQELRAAISFFEGKPGRKYVQYQRVRSSAMLGGASQESEPGITPGDLEAINAFL